MSNYDNSSTVHQMGNLQIDKTKVEIFGLFKWGKTFTGQFELDVDSNHFLEVLNKVTDHPNEQLKIDSLNELIRLREKSDTDLFLDNLVKLVRSEEEIWTATKDFPDGGFAFCLLIDCLIPSKSEIYFIRPKELTKLRTHDYSVEPYLSSKTRSSKELDIEERMLLHILALLCKESPTSGMVNPNDYLLSLIPHKNLDWVAETLGKLQALKMTSVESLDRLKHRMPIRSIWVKNEKAKEIELIVSKAIRYLPQDRLLRLR